MSNLPQERQTPPLAEVVTDPQVGDLAYHYGGLDPRRVSKVSKDGTTISITIGEQEIGGLPASNYKFRRLT